ncbi:hypothetical protein [Nocardia gipuzkoensis]|uniref:hypothetical protein n=1 Tax=Nocardia gipuzkoensis TaxID=2749991 RepID=UPI002457C748|nr:hypothetical protein [Nocardia gipuzkoensis]
MLGSWVGGGGGRTPGAAGVWSGGLLWGRHGCDECQWTGSGDADLVASVPDSEPADVEVDGGRPVHELDYAQRMDGAR